MIIFFADCDDQLCLECSSKNSTECFACDTTSNEKIIYDSLLKKCVCIRGFYRDGIECKPCNVLCKECTGPSNRDCLPNKCSDKAYAIEHTRTTCLYMCKTPEDNLYIDENQRICKGIFYI